MSVAVEERRVAPDTSSFLLRFQPGRDLPEVSSPGEAAPAQVARLNSAVAVFDGHVFDKEALAHISGADPASADAELALRAYFELGPAVFSRIDGVFALVIWDPRSGSILAARDPLGHHPLFYAMGRDGAWYFSDSIVALARADGVSTAINRPALAASLINYHLDAAETYFEAIRRVPAGRALTTGPSGATSERYWDPAPTEQAVEWITEADIPHFSTVLERALGRALSVGRPSIFLSGGIDSVAVATYASDVARATSTEPPIALSLVFPDPNFNEERVQRLVAGELGMPQTVIPFADAEGHDGLVLEALRTTSSWPMPLVNIWHPLYTQARACGPQPGRPDGVDRSGRRRVALGLTSLGCRLHEGPPLLGATPFLAHLPEFVHGSQVAGSPQLAVEVRSEGDRPGRLARRGRPRRSEAPGRGSSPSYPRTNGSLAGS